MILQGNISYFSVFMVLQLLASYEKSGVLELEDNEEKALIYIKDGYVEAVSVPRSDHLLGARLVKRGYLSPTELRRVLLSAALSEKEEFLGITLMKSGLIDEKAMMQVLEEQAYENTLELSNWIKGSFKFVVSSRLMKFPVSPHINVQHLLLETSRRLDEGQRPTKEKESQPGEELCISCSVGCDQNDRIKYLKDGICLWRNMPVVVREALFTYDSDGNGFSGDEEDVRDLPFL
ncbi:MAG: DUF4388 domain-containing protein [Thermoleophilia bacterium]